MIKKFGQIYFAIPGFSKLNYGIPGLGKKQIRDSGNSPIFFRESGIQHPFITPHYSPERNARRKYVTEYTLHH